MHWDELPVDTPRAVSVTAGGKTYRGEVIVASAWRPELAQRPSRNVSFRIVFLSQPERVQQTELVDRRVAVCSVGTSVRLLGGQETPAKSIRESTGRYSVGHAASFNMFARGEVVLSGGRVAAQRFFRPKASLQQVVRAIAASLVRQRPQPGVEQMSNQGPVEEIRAFLRDAVLPAGQDQLSLDKIALSQEVAGEAGLKNPQSWPMVQWAFDWFRDRYAQLYVKHHEEFSQDAKALKSQLQEAAGQVLALQRLNSIEELGPPLGNDVAKRLQRVAAEVRPCSQALTKEDAKRRPRCPRCNLSLADQPPTAEVEALLRDLHQALEERCRRLSSSAIRQVLAQSREPQLEQFLTIVQASDFSSLVTVLDDDLADFLRRFLRRSQRRVALKDVVGELQRRFPEVAAWQIPEVVETFQSILQQRFTTPKGSSTGAS